MKRILSTITLRLFGWRVVQPSHELKRCILIGAPHTRNWDFPLAILGMSALNIKAIWVAKKSLFRGPLKYIFNSLSGIPLNRKFCSSFLLEISYLLKNKDERIIAMMPEGTRSKKDYWMPGFYHIAANENIPIALGYIDYKKKIIGIGNVIQPSTVEADMKIIQDFYFDKVGKVTRNKSEVMLRDKDINKILERERLKEAILLNKI